MTVQFPEGAIVRHTKFGLGKVLLTDGQSVWVYFKDIEGEPKDAVKRLSLSVAALEMADQQADPVLDNLPPMVHAGQVVPPKRIRLTEKQSVDQFVAGYRSFEDQRYLSKERNYKWEAHIRVRDGLLKAPGRSLVTRDPEGELPKLMRGLISSTNLLATQEVIRLNEAFKIPGAARAYGAALLGFVDAPSSRTFDALVEAIDRLPANQGQRILTWPVVTLLPFLAEPTRHMFLKPKVTQRVAEVFMFDLLYDSTPTWTTYQRLMTLSERLLNRLRPLGARDFIDVQSFMWIVEGIAYMRK